MEVEVNQKKKFQFRDCIKIKVAKIRGLSAPSFGFLPGHSVKIGLCNPQMPRFRSAAGKLVAHFVCGFRSEPIVDMNDGVSRT